MTKVIIKMKQRFRVIRFISFLSRTFRVALIIYYLPLKHQNLVQFVFFPQLICLLPVEKTKFSLKSIDSKFQFLFSMGVKNFSNVVLVSCIQYIVNAACKNFVSLQVFLFFKIFITYCMLSGILKLMILLFEKM